MENISIVPGAVEFVAPDGKQYRYESKNNGVYELNGECDWIHIGTYHGKSTSPSSILRYINKLK